MEEYRNPLKVLSRSQEWRPSCREAISPVFASPISHWLGYAPVVPQHYFKKIVNAVGILDGGPDAYNNGDSLRIGSIVLKERLCHHEACLVDVPVLPAPYRPTSSLVTEAKPLLGLTS